MKYVFIELETDLDGKIQPGVYTKDNQEEAMALFHSFRVAAESGDYT